MKNEPINAEIGIGATDELSLRVSVATLVRVLLEDPTNGELLLALERKATLQKQNNATSVQITVQPFGGALRILDVPVLKRAIGNFHFDSQRSRAEGDFRIFIRPDAWEMVQEFCLQQFARPGSPALENDPGRELTEEFASTMQTNLMPEQWACNPVGTVIENTPSPTANAYSQGSLTARVLRVFEAHIIDSALARHMVTVSHHRSKADLETLALENVQRGGRGWANTVLTLPWKPLVSFFGSLKPEALNLPIIYQGHFLDETIAAILESLNVPKYRRL